MKILVLSDSHSGMSFMRCCVEKVKPDCVVHLGDYYEDAQALAQENPHLRFHLVPGNCDRFRCRPGQPEILVYPIFGVRFYMTHGHLHGVKSGMRRLLADARAGNAQAVLYGHTHRAECCQEPDGLWVMNPGSCGSYGGSAGIIDVQQEKITACRIIGQADLEQME